MSEINSFSRFSGSQGTAVVRALDKTQQSNTQQDKTREARVADLKDQYQSGLYIVDTVHLSSAIVDELLNTKR